MRPLPAVLLDLYEDLATGKLVLRRDRVVKSVDLVNGNPVASAQTPRDETLGHFLVSSGTISETEHQQAIARATTVGGTLGEALVALQILTFEQLIDQLGRQARHKLVAALRWAQGAWRFDEESHAAEGMQLRMLDVVFGGLRETTAMATRLERLDNLSFELTERGKRLHHELRKTLGERSFAALSAGAVIGEIERAYDGGDRAEARALVDALLMCDAITTAAIPLGLGVPAAAHDDAYELSFEDESAHTTSPDMPRAIADAIAEAAAVEPEASEPIELGPIIAAASSSQLPQVSAEPPADLAARAHQAIAAELARTRGADHYAVLLVDRDASKDDIEAAYQIKLALFDRTAAGAKDAKDAKDAELVRHAYAAAFATLSDARERAAYDRGRAKPADPAAPAQAAVSDTRTGTAIGRSAASAGHVDAAFLVAATMVALGTADDSMAGLYARHRQSGVRLPGGPLSADDWAALRHRDDTPELGALVELVAPAIHALAPMTLADGDLAPGARVGDDDLLPAFRRLRGKLAAIAGVGEAPVYLQAELGQQIHVVAADPPVLVAGEEALHAPESPELVFRLARALTFLWPGRAVGASRPGRVLRAVVMAIVREALGSELGRGEPLAASADAAVAALPADVREKARAQALRLLSATGGALNLSTWARSLTRTADRAGMLLCGDVPAAVAGAREVGELAPDLVEFAYGSAHIRLRARLGLTL